MNRIRIKDGYRGVTWERIGGWQGRRDMLGDGNKKPRIANDKDDWQAQGYDGRWRSGNRSFCIDK